MGLLLRELLEGPGGGRRRRSNCLIAVTVSLVYIM